MSDSSGRRGDDLVERLTRLEAEQRAEQAAPDAPVRRWTRGVRLPPGGALPQSTAWLERLYEGELVPREKKPQVVDTRRSWGPYLVSVDDDPMVLIDACSQIATLTHGFAHPRMIDGIYEGRFDRCLWANPDNLVEPSPELEDYGRALLERAPAGLEHACFVTAGGAEANEKAFRIARMHAGTDEDRAQRTRVLAFKNGFHGRTLVSLMATWNPIKRGPFELPGYEARFSEVSADGVARVLADHGAEIGAAILEPMMAEGGDVHLPRELVLAVREATRAHGIPLIADEVQTGFCTGGPSFFWWRRLGLGETPETSPDLLTCAKKAGLGVVLSRWPDPEPTAVSVSTALRGLVALETAHEQVGLEAELEPRLMELAARFDIIASPRIAGTTFAFDLPDADARTRFIDQRFMRGLMTYPAGERTIRFRLNASFEPRVLDDLFARIAEALALLDRPDEATAWYDEGKPTRRSAGVAVREVEEGDWPRIMEIEYATYEPARVDSEQTLRAAAADGVGLVAYDADGGQVLGFAFAGPIELRTDASGPDRDGHQGKHDSIYSADVTVAAAAQGRGVGRALKEGQLAWARKNGFSFVTGRNRVGATQAMERLNRSLGAYVVVRMENQYEGDAQADYYRIPLRPPQRPELDEADTLIDLASGMQSPFGPAPAYLDDRELVGPATSRLNLSNWTTPDIVHYAEHLREILPRGCQHLYFTSSRDETVDKSLRCLKISRADARVAVGLEGGYVGHNTAVARSISDPRGFGRDFALFDWPRIPHPADDPTASVRALDALVEAHGAGALFGIYAEVVGERSGKVLEGQGALMLSEACKRHDLPLVLVESATGMYRSGDGVWGVDGLPDDLVPDMVLWYPGGQLGHVFVSERYYVDKPLTLISTWDGDELSVIHTHEALRAAAKSSVQPAAAALRDAVHELAASVDGQVGGRGLYLTVSTTPERAESMVKAAADAGLRLRLAAPGVIAFCPRLDIRSDVIRERVVDLLRRVART